MVKTVNLDGTEVEVTGLGGQNTAVKNLGGSEIYASPYPNIEAGADNVVEIPAGGGELVFDTLGTIYLKGSGKVQLTGTSYSTVNFKQPSSSDGGGLYVLCGVAALPAMLIDECYCEQINFEEV